MTEGERYVGSLPAKTDFHDRSKRRSYVFTRAVATRLVDNPTLIRNGQAYLERHMRGDPRQSRYYAMWTDLLRQDVTVIARRLLEDSPDGDLLRDTQPVFVVLSPSERAGGSSDRPHPTAGEMPGVLSAP
ncbi:hypothetical protein SAMN02799631_01914 [Methylobacterium sp. 174MFSha1.1]|uniref:hypothetical protein n=1 Tax=Methylobacterium sp. 174MFSha1.1 TaxID=1502749 RepID=UPI0008E7EFD4|nr:hypothetical protein [Methylobacterium sp. 174MFSha1.1]SFU71354.1 hypothetical protein SAMN02799631_01914 [Methylobacterium sp. 174MFSha1.1]